MKQAADNLTPDTGITFHRGCVSYEGTITSRRVFEGIVMYEVDVVEPDGGTGNASVGIHDGQIDRVHDGEAL